MVIRAKGVERARLQNLATALELAGHKSIGDSAVNAPLALLRFQNGVRFTAWGNEFAVEQRISKNSTPDSKYLMAIARSVVQVLGFENLDQVTLRSHFLHKNPNPFKFVINTIAKGDVAPYGRPYTLQAARASLIYTLEPCTAFISPQARSHLTVSIAPHEKTSVMREPHLSIKTEVTFDRIASAEFFNLERDGEYYDHVVDEVVSYILRDNSHGV